ncbi:MAG: ribose 5-phosphate isomerase B [Oscillospiraceae bacterium]|nr:ribose 5-phosphate isomerase B [Oscillospiraceae bacterium]
MKIAVAADHGGFDLKEIIKRHLENRGVEILDLGTYSHESVHYPVFGARCAHAVADGECDFGIVVCTTGIGISITANKIPGIRCALCSDVLSAELTRRHNNANMLALGGAIVGPGLALRIVDAFLSASFEGGRHQIRVDMIRDAEEGRL